MSFRSRLILPFLHFAVHCIKCFECTGDTLEMCVENETLKNCDSDVDVCVSAEATIPITANDSHVTYLKKCWNSGHGKFCSILPPASNAHCVENPCDKDYCNGVAPTTLAPSTKSPTNVRPTTKNDVPDPTSDCGTASGKAFHVLSAGAISVIAVRLFA